MGYQRIAATCKYVQRSIRQDAQRKRGINTLIKMGACGTPHSSLSMRSLCSAPHPSESFLTAANNAYMEEMYAVWKENPQKVHISWDVYFRQVESGAPPGQAFMPPPSVQSGHRQSSPIAMDTPASQVSSAERNDALGLSYLIRAYQSRGHEVARLDPLEIQDRPDLPELKIEMYGFTQADLDRTITIPKNFASGVSGFLEELSEGKKMTLGQIVERLKETYCHTIGVQYMHILNRDRCNWIRTKMEHLVREEETKQKQMHTLERLAFSVVFERFLGNKYNTTKRFGLEGAESLIPGLKYMIDRATELGMEHLVIGMPHRGRLNVLSNVIRKPIQQIFKEFQGTHIDVEQYQRDQMDDWSNSGDVKYHLGTSYDRMYPDGRRVHLSLVANPSHLEAVNPVVVGKVRAKQFYLGNDAEAERKVMPLLLHGDAAFSGQGIVYETMHFAGLENYDTGGTIHVVVNNQIGFTTDPTNSRSSQYCSDVGKAMDIPILHVNADDPIAVVKVFELAAEWRQYWRSDVIINLTCYRRFGHNEIDNPMFTQPIMYKKIAQMTSVLEKYIERLVSSKIAKKEDCQAIVDKVWKFFERTFEESTNWESAKKSDWLANRWESFKSPNQQSRIRLTGVDFHILKHIGAKVCEVPEGFDINRQLARILKAKKDTIDTGSGVDWGTAEALAWGSLLLEGNHVRISGQDVERGTFSHRHSVLHDQNSNNEYVALNHLASKTLPSAPIHYTPSDSAEISEVQAEFVACNSTLSEFGVMGYELGYSLENPNALVMWEAQFGDFVNGAQIIIDQFLSAGEDKWMRQSGLVLLLPHGYEGQGAEHSSCRVERFLQMTDDEPDVVPPMDEENRMQIQQTNWQVAYPSTPAQYFHILRRQIHRDFRKPLISVQPKHLLRLRQASSKLEDMSEGTRFQRLIPEAFAQDLVADDAIKRVIFCSGKVYYDLLQHRQEKKIDNVALVRIEQIAPFPFDKVAEEAAKYTNSEIFWVQEEPQNMGFWTYVAPRFETALKKINNDDRRPKYIGRSPSAAPATGYYAIHVLEQNKIVSKALSTS